MAVSALVGPSPLPAEPGSLAACDVLVRNSGTDPEEVHLRLRGEPGPWGWVVPATIRLEPGAEAVARLSFRLPRTPHPPAGPLPYAVELTCEGRPGPPVSVEATLDVARFSEVLASLEPATSEGRRCGEHTLVVANRGNASESGSTEGIDPDGAVEVDVDPDRLSVGPGATATALVAVRPRRRVLTGRARPHGFQVAYRPDSGGAVTATGSMRQQPALGGPSARVVAATVVALLVVAVGLRATVLAPGDDAGPGPGGALVGASEPEANPACPAEGRKDPGVSGLADRERRRLLPRDYSFTFVSPDGCRPARMNPCEPVHYVTNPALAPPGGLADVAEAFARLSAATGITFVDDGPTDEPFSEGRQDHQPARYGERWAPILVAWAHLSGGRGGIQVVGRGRPSVRDGVVVSGMLGLNVGAVTDAEKGTPLRGGFGPAGGFDGIGPEGVTWGRVILHELAHIANLGHSGSRTELMYPETAEQTTRTAQFGRGDLAGLALLGRQAGCLDPPPLPAGQAPTVPRARLRRGG